MSANCDGQAAQLLAMLLLISPGKGCPLPGFRLVFLQEHPVLPFADQEQQVLA